MRFCHERISACLAMAGVLILFSFSSSSYAMDPAREYNAKKAECLTYCMRSLGRSSEWCSANVDPNTMSGCFKAFVPADCPGLWGGTMRNGESVTAYQESTVLSPKTCTSQSRKCVNGIVKGIYKHPSCTVEYRPCSLPWGGSLAHNGSITAYQASSVTSPASCVSETRLCVDGALEGSFNYSSCNLKYRDCSLPWGGSIPHNDIIAAYQSSSVMSPGSCVGENRTCRDGTLDGTFSNQSCNIELRSCNLPWGGTVAHGSNVTAYQASSVTSPASCTSQTRTCNDGTLGGSYAHQNCNSEYRSCNLPWGGTLAHGGTVTAYQASSVTSPATCTSETRTCNDGTLDGGYTSQNCNVQMRSCNLPWGGTLAHGSNVTAYQASSVTSPASCVSQSRTCSDGTLNGGYTSQTCQVNNPQPRACGPAGSAWLWNGVNWDDYGYPDWQPGDVNTGSVTGLVVTQSTPQGDPRAISCIGSGVTVGSGDFLLDKYITSFSYPASFKLLVKNISANNLLITGVRLVGSNGGQGGTISVHGGGSTQVLLNTPNQRASVTGISQNWNAGHDVVGWCYNVPPNHPACNIEVTLSNGQILTVEQPGPNSVIVN